MTLTCEIQSFASAAATGVTEAIAAGMGKKDRLAGSPAVTRNEALTALFSSAELTGLNDADLVLLTTLTGMVSESDWKAGRLGFKDCDTATLARLTGLDVNEAGKALDRLETGGLVNVAGAGDGARMMIDIAPFAARATELEWLCAIEEFGTAGKADGDVRSVPERIARIFETMTLNQQGGDAEGPVSRLKALFSARSEKSRKLASLCRSFFGFWTYPASMDADRSGFGSAEERERVANETFGFLNEEQQCDDQPAGDFKFADDGKQDGKSETLGDFHARMASAPQPATPAPAPLARHAAHAAAQKADEAISDLNRNWIKIRTQSVRHSPRTGMPRHTIPPVAMARLFPQALSTSQ